MTSGSNIIVGVLSRLPGIPQYQNPACNYKIPLQGSTTIRVYGMFGCFWSILLLLNNPSHYPYYWKIDWNTWTFLSSLLSNKQAQLFFMILPYCCRHSRLDGWLCWIESLCLKRRDVLRMRYRLSGYLIKAERVPGLCGSEKSMRMLKWVDKMWSWAHCCQRSNWNSLKSVGCCAWCWMAWAEGQRDPPIMCPKLFIWLRRTFTAAWAVPLIIQLLVFHLFISGTIWFLCLVFHTRVIGATWPHLN